MQKLKHENQVLKNRNDHLEDYIYRLNRTIMNTIMGALLVAVLVFLYIALMMIK